MLQVKRETIVMNNALAVLRARSHVRGAFNSDAEAIAWMLTPHQQLDGRTPVMVLMGAPSAVEPGKQTIPPQYPRNRRRRAQRR